MFWAWDSRPRPRSREEEARREGDTEGSRQEPVKEEPKLSAAEVEKQLDAAFPAFLKDPSEANFLKVHRLVVAHPAYAPYSSELDEGARFDQGQESSRNLPESLTAAK